MLQCLQMTVCKLQRQWLNPSSAVCDILMHSWYRAGVCLSIFWDPLSLHQASGYVARTMNWEVIIYIIEEVPWWIVGGVSRPFHCVSWVEKIGLSLVNTPCGILAVHYTLTNTTAWLLSALKRILWNRRFKVGAFCRNFELHTESNEGFWRLCSKFCSKK